MWKVQGQTLVCIRNKGTLVRLSAILGFLDISAARRRALVNTLGLLFIAATLAWAQLATGELRLSVIDPSGLPLPCSGTLVSDAPAIQRDFETNDAGRFTFQHLPSAVYRLTVRHAGFTPSSTLIEIRSGVPVETHVQLSLQPASTNVQVTDAQTLVDPHQTGVVYSVGTQQIQEQQSSVPGRGILDLINMQPGWLFEANAVLHPRGSEYQTLFVVDGVPMDENRSPAFAPSLETGEVQSMSILTANYPAEYGRKLGGVVEVTTSRDIQQGFHGSAEFGEEASEPRLASCLAPTAGIEALLALALLPSTQIATWIRLCSGTTPTPPLWTASQALTI